VSVVCGMTAHGMCGRFEIFEVKSTKCLCLLPVVLVFRLKNLILFASLVMLKIAFNVYRTGDIVSVSVFFRRRRRRSSSLRTANRHSDNNRRYITAVELTTSLRLQLNRATTIRRPTLRPFGLTVRRPLHCG